MLHVFKLIHLFFPISGPAEPFKNNLIYFTEYFSYERPTISSSALQNLQIRILVIENRLTLPPSVPSLNIALFITSLCLYDNFLSLFPMIVRMNDLFFLRKKKAPMDPIG